MPSDGRDGGASSVPESNTGYATTTKKLNIGSNTLETRNNHSRPSQTSTQSKHSVNANANGRNGVDIPLIRIHQEPPLAEVESDGLTTIPHELDQRESPDGSKDESVDEVDAAIMRPYGQSAYVQQKNGNKTNGKASLDDVDRIPIDLKSDGLTTIPHELDPFESPDGSKDDSVDEMDVAIMRPSGQSAYVQQKNGNKTNGKASLDDVDHIPIDLKPSGCDLLGNIIGIGSYVFDVGSDCWVANAHFVRSNWWWFGLTLGFVIGPSLITTFFSTMWYIQDHHQESSESKKKKVSTRRWVSRFIFLFFQVAPVLRYLDSIIFCCRGRMANKKGDHDVQRHCYERMLHENTDAKLLRLMECFTEAAPQLVLQLYIISTNGLDDATAQILSCVTSLCSLSWAFASYHKTLRRTLHDKSNLHWEGVALLLLWRVFTIGARVSAMALFASEVSPCIFAVAIALHWLVMFIWCLTQSTSFCQHAWQKRFFKAVMSVVYIFGFLNFSEGNTRFRYLFFYALVCLENLGMMMVWFWMGGTDMPWFHKGAIVSVVLIGFLVGVTFQIVYYKYFHPNIEPPIRCCLPWAEVCHSCRQRITPSRER